MSNTVARIRSTHRRVLAALALSLAAVGCGDPAGRVQSDADGDSAERLRPVQTVVVSSDISDRGAGPVVANELVNPLAVIPGLEASLAPASRTFQLMQGPPDLHDRTELAIQSCMKERGYVYEPWLQTAHISEFDAAQMTGFNVGSSLGRVGPLPHPNLGPPPYIAHVERLNAEQRERYLATLGPESEAASSGSACRGVAERSVRAKLPTFDRTFMSIVGNRLDEIVASEGYTAALRTYRSCMADAGVVASGHTDAQRAAEETWKTTSDNAKALQREVQIAVRNFTCRRSTTDAEIRAQEAGMLAEVIRDFPQYKAYLTSLA